MNELSKGDGKKGERKKTLLVGTAERRCLRTNFRTRKSKRKKPCL
jgi:hypothetical protein